MPEGGHAQVAVLVDLSRLHDPTGDIVAALIDAHRAGGDLDPPVPLVVSGAFGRVASRIQTSGLARSVPTFDTLASGRAGVASGVPPPIMRRATFPSACTSVALARDLVGQAVSRRAPLLHLAVEDGDVELPRILADRAGGHAPLADRDRGLRLVAERANAWGASPCPGGKVVWATMSVTARPSTVAR